VNKIVALVLLLSGPFLVGCEGEEEVGAKPPSSPPLTKAQLIKEFEAICGRRARRFEATVAPLAKNPTPAQARAYILDTLVPELESQLAALRALEPPRADLPRVDQMLDEWTEAVETLKARPLKEAARFGELTARGDRIGAKYGLKDCVK
jgi:hypothetical protein